MSQLRYLLIAMTVSIIILTTTAVLNGGLDLITPFFGPIFEMTWQGQFNFDFVCYLVLSGIWMAWRGGFTSSSVALGVLAPPLGILFFAPYLIYLIGKSGGDIRHLLLGVHSDR